MKKNLSEIVRFLLLGGFATVCDYAVFYTFNLVLLPLIGLGKTSNWNIFIATFLGFVVGLLINWFFSNNFVFRNNTKLTGKKFLIYLVICLFGLGITELGMLLAKPLFDTYYWTWPFRFDFWKIFFKVILTCIVLVINYLGRKYFIFTKEKESN